MFEGMGALARRQAESSTGRGADRPTRVHWASQLDGENVADVAEAEHARCIFHAPPHGPNEGAAGMQVVGAS